MAPFRDARALPRVRGTAVLIWRSRQVSTGQEITYFDTVFFVLRLLLCLIGRANEARRVHAAVHPASVLWNVLQCNSGWKHFRSESADVAGDSSPI